MPRDEDPIRTLGWEAAKSYTSRIQAGSITASRITANCLDITAMQMAAMYPIDISTHCEPGKTIAHRLAASRRILEDIPRIPFRTERVFGARGSYAECTELQTPAYRSRND